MDTSLSLLDSKLKAWCDFLVRQKKRSPRTVESYRSVIEELQAFLSDQPLDSELLRNFLQSLSQRLAPRSQALYVSAIKNFLEWFPDHNPQKKKKLLRILKQPRLKKHLVKVVDEEDLLVLFKHIKELDAQEQLLFYLLYSSALRISEAMELRWENVDWNNREFTLLGKGRRRRRVPISEDTLKTLEALREQDNLWPPNFNARQARDWVARWGKESGIEEHCGRLHPHKLRHSIATHLLQRGARLPQIQRLLGHKRLSSTERYTHLNIQDLLKVYDRSLPRKLLKKD